MAHRENSDCGAYDQMIDEDAENYNQDKKQVFMSMWRPGAGLIRPRLLAASLTLLAAVLLLVDIGLGVHYSKLTDGHFMSEDVSHINEELIRLQNDYKIATESMRYAYKQMSKEIRKHQVSKWELDHQKKRKTDSEELNTKLQRDNTELETHLKMSDEGCRRCLPGWIFMNSQCYYFSLGIRSWQKAREYCQSPGGDLVIIESSTKQASIVNHINSILPSTTKMGDRGFWIGLRDVHEEGTWKWSNGRTMVEGYWHDGEPNDINDEDCAAVYGRTNPFKTWNDVGCAEWLKWICEMAPRATS
ncbi:uncharacterized protein LOC143009547 [Genypterus blacodes]|uniref:uncharacterized protein LOC143009547 n=1 Tax=Genypterus blacodes TaxID=154954 RepID=UPI003F76A329